MRANEQIKRYDHVLIIDAMKSGEVNASFVSIDASQLPSTTSKISSHEVGVIESTALLASLQQLPEQLVIIGIADCRDEYVKKIVNMY